MDLTGLRQILDNRFDEDELRTLCFDLRVDYGSLAGEGKAGKARELVGYLERRGRIQELIEYGRRQRPEISWPETTGLAQWEPEMVLILAGEFWMGTDRQDLELAGIEWEDWMEYEIPCQQVYLPDYAIGKYPVTNAEFARFIKDGGYRNPQFWTEAGWRERQSQGWEQPRFWDDRRYNNPRQPVVEVSWYEAAAYCTWLAVTTWRPYRLPTEVEWEKAARGTDGRLWPWGNRWDPRRCNTSEGGPNQRTPVGRYSPRGDSPYGVADMAGNVWEWTASEYEPGSGACVVRGGAWDVDGRYARCASCSWGFPVDFNYNVGLRVAMSLALPPSDF